jgi:uncharacterized membrane protein
VDGDGLFRLGEKMHFVVRMTTLIGSFLVEGQTIAEISADEPLDEATKNRIRGAFVIGHQRTTVQDVEFGIIRIADIAARALSPGINDPTTAVQCIDRLTQILACLGRREPPAERRTKEGRVHFIAMHTSFERAVQIAFGQIIHFGSKNPLILTKLHDSMSLLRELVPPKNHPPIAALLGRLGHLTDA